MSWGQYSMNIILSALEGWNDMQEKNILSVRCSLKAWPYGDRICKSLAPVGSRAWRRGQWHPYSGLEVVGGCGAPSDRGSHLFLWKPWAVLAWRSPACWGEQLSRDKTTAGVRGGGDNMMKESFLVKQMVDGRWTQQEKTARSAEACDMCENNGPCCCHFIYSSACFLKKKKKKKLYLPNLESLTVVGLCWL